MGDEIDAIVRGMTKAQRDAVTDASAMPVLFYGEGVWEVRAGGATVALCKKGVIRSREFRSLTGRTRRGYVLTPRGLAVRARLMEKPNA